MVCYKCLRCGSSFSKKSDIKRHLNRKKQCFPTVMDISAAECCRIIDSKDKEEVQNLLIEEIIRLKMEKPSIETNIQGDVVNNTVNFYINLQINSFKDTDYSILKDYIYKCIEKNKNNVPNIEDMVKKVHFNKDKPENHNIYKPNARENKYLVFDKESNSFLIDRNADAFILEKIEEVFNEILKEKKINKIKSHFESLDEVEYTESIKQGIKDVLYNYKHITQNTQKIITQ